MKKTVLIAAAALLAAAFIFSCVPYSAKDNSTLATSEISEKSPEDCLTETYFIGDSNTAHLTHSGYTAIAGMVDPAHVWTGGGSTLMLDLEMHVLDPETKKSVSVRRAVGEVLPKYIVITLGYNGYVGEVAEKASLDRLFCLAYKSLIRDIKSASPETRIIVQSIFPVTVGSGVSDPDGANLRIDELNNLLQGLAAECGVRYLDTSSVLKDPATNCLRDEYSKCGSFYHEDGYHLSDLGLLAVLNYIKENAYR